MQSFAKLRVVMAFVFAPMVAASAITTASPFQDPKAFVADALILAAFMGLGIVLIGLPLFLVASAKGWLQITHALLAGFATGALFTMLLGGGLGNSLIYGLVGAAAGALFWFMALFRNPLYPSAQRGAR